MSDSGAIMGTSTTVKTLADGSLRLAIDIDPRDAQQAFAMFGSPGTPIALARITNEAANAHAQTEKREPEAEKPKGGELAKWVALRCEEPEFQQFLDVKDAAEAAKRVRKLCQVKSRAEFDNDPKAEAEFHRMIRGPWLRYRDSRGLKLKEK